jgi:hypothetical protein
VTASRPGDERINHERTAVAQTAAGFSSLDSSSEAPTSLVRKILPGTTVHRPRETDMEVRNLPFVRDFAAWRVSRIEALLGLHQRRPNVSAET